VVVVATLAVALGFRQRLLAVLVVGAIGLAVSLAVVQLVVLKMLPFDNKSEFQVVLDMPEMQFLRRLAVKAASDTGGRIIPVDFLREWGWPEAVIDWVLGTDA
jgi:hypothetical protein